MTEPILECPKCNKEPTILEILKPDNSKYLRKGFILKCDHIQEVDSIKGFAILKWNEKCKELE